MGKDDFFDEIFAEEDSSENVSDGDRWKILVVDDEEDVHAVSRMALDDFSFRNKSLEILSAYSAEEARLAFEKHPDIALVFLDVVMESGSAGLDLVDYIRTDMANEKVRIVLRTGQPGAAPEKQVVERHGIDDYRLKTDLTSEGLFSTTLAGLRTYESIIEGENRRRSLENRLAARTAEFQKANQDLSLTRLSLEHSALHIFWLTPEGRFLYVNKTAANSLDCEPEELVSATFAEIDPDYAPDKREEFWRKLKSEKMLTFETSHKGKDGRLRPMLVKSHYIEQDGLEYEFCFAIDISDRKNAEKERDQLRRQFLRSQKMESIGTLAGGIAHDFNNILAAVLGYTELALFGAERDSDLKENLQEIYKAGKRAKDLVKQILTFARQSEGEPRPLQVGLVAKEVLKLIRPTIPASIEIKNKIRSKSLVDADPSKIHQILMNLCANAAQAMEEKGGTMEIGLQDVVLGEDFASLHGELAPGDYIEITVKDTGVGIPMDVVPDIFDPYFTTKASGEGTGLGLSVVHGIVKSHGGEILVESQVGRGTVFSVFLPTTKKLDDKVAFSSDFLPTGNERILIVDDEEPLTRLLGKLLEYQGYQVQVRVCSVEALELFKKKSDDFDLVITDMEMPNLTGDQLTAAIKQIRPDIPVVLCTGFSKKISEDRTAELGIDALLMKPVSKEDLAKTVRKVLDDFEEYRLNNA